MGIVGATTAAVFATGGQPTPAAANTSASTVERAASSTANCPPEILTLPPLVGDNAAGVTAMNGGVVAGFSQNVDQAPSARDAVVWPDGSAPVSLGVSDSATPVDVNDSGVVAVWSLGVRSKAWLWDNGTLTRLPSPPHADAVISAVNNRGVAAGALFRNGRSRPVVWRGGVLSRLPVPRGADGEASAINNHGLVVGTIDPGVAASTSPAWWRIGGGSGRLRLPDRLRRLEDGLAVNDRGRIVAGGAPHAIKWRDIHAAPRFMHGTLKDFDAVVGPWAAGAFGGFDGFGSRAIVARLSDGVFQTLPNPPNPVVWNNAFGLAVTRGVTSFAPQGGVSVGGYAEPGDDSGQTVALLWTCSQTLLP